ncbi:UDP-N-acetylmuramoyl-tripeptide--D-alanyl-D-alanine ligase [Candidatus Giovannonibacteria bacterium]|nr:UDP-N-acetylmuramoyl-tripeptide--D-alanyl-D-alanine ligase [Candidatus Giovannonibacteria bacterium]
MKDILKKAVVFILTWESKRILSKYNPKIVAVTGSVGKTSTKDAIAKVLERKYKIRKSEKSYNSELGVPLTVIGAKSGWGSLAKWISILWKGLEMIINNVPYPEILVLEIGADRPGDIKKIRRLINPDVAVLTTFAETPVHVEFFNGPEEVFLEKAELIKGLPASVNVLLNMDDEEVMKLKDKTSANILTYGMSDGAQFFAYDYGIFYQKEGKKSRPEGIAFKIKFQNQEFTVKIINAFGRHHVYPALSAIAVASIFNISVEDSVEALSLYSPPPGRLKLIRGNNETLILDDTYNSSPKALAAALDVMGELEAKRKIAVLGDMLELGRHTITAHRDLGRNAAQVADILCTVGVRAKFFMEGAMKEGFKKKTIYTFGTSEDAGKELQKIIQPGDLILVKGSQSMRMEKIVENLMAEPEKKAELLCRQDEEWKKI